MDCSPLILTENCPHKIDSISFQETQGIDAVTQPNRSRSIGEYMSKMRLATMALNLHEPYKASLIYRMLWGPMGLSKLDVLPDSNFVVELKKGAFAA